MLACNDPYDAYQRVEFDAWVKGASPNELVQICFDQLIISVSTAILADERCDARLKSRAVTRAVTALIALEMGIDREHEMADVLSEFYGAARKSILASSVTFDRDVLANMRDDFSELRSAFRR